MPIDLPRDRRSSSSSIPEADEDIPFHEFEQKEKAENSPCPAHDIVSSEDMRDEDIFCLSECDQLDFDWLMAPVDSPLIPSSDMLDPADNGFAWSSPPRMWSPPSEAVSKVICKGDDDDSQNDNVAGPLFQKMSPPAACADALINPSKLPASSATPALQSAGRLSTLARSPLLAGGIRAPPSAQLQTTSSTSSSSRLSSMPAKGFSSSTPANSLSRSSGKTSASSKQSVLGSRSVSSGRPSSISACRGWQLDTHLAAPAGTLQKQPVHSQVNRPISHPQGPPAWKIGSKTTTAAAKPIHSAQAFGAVSHTKNPSSNPLKARRHLFSESLNEHKIVTQKMIPSSHGENTLLSKDVDKTLGRPTPQRRPPVMSEGRKSTTAMHAAVKAPNLAYPQDTKTHKRAQQPTRSNQCLSKKSLDTSLRHLDIRGSGTNSPTSSLQSVRSRNRLGNSHSSLRSSSPLATSSYTSSEQGMTVAVDPESSDYFDETSSDMGSRASITSCSDSAMAFSNERKVSHWLASPCYLDGASADDVRGFEEGLANFYCPESDLMSQDEAILVDGEFALEPV